MAFTIVAHLAAQSTDTNGFVTSPLNTLGATLIIMAVADYTGVTAADVTDSEGNNYFQYFQETDGGPGVSRLTFVATGTTPLPTMSAAMTWTVNSTGGFPALAILAVSGGVTSGTLDDSVVFDNTGALGSTTAQPGSISPSLDNELLTTAIMFNAPTTTATIDSGFTIQDQLTNVSGIAFGIAMATLIETTATAQNPTWTMSLANQVPLGMVSWFVSTGKRFLLTPF